MRQANSRSVPALLIPVMLVSGVAGCSRGDHAAGTAPVQGIHVSAVSDGVRLTNPTGHRIYYAAFERIWVEQGLFIWGLCIDPATCPSVAPHESVTIPLSQISGWSELAREARVYYWRLVPASAGGWEPADLQSVVLRL